MATSRENLPTHPGVTEDLDPGPVLGLFEGFGIELEAMLVDSRTFDVRPIADLVLHDLAGRPVEEVARGRARTSNELVMHVLEVKTNGPVPRLGGVAGILHDALLDVDRAASAHGARVLPGAVHPRMLPAKETSVWFHQNDEIYAAFDRCIEKLDKQLRRYKRRLKDHHRDRSEPVVSLGVPSYVLASSEDTETDEPDSLQPMIIAEMETKIPSLTVGEAVMQMELAGAPVLVFRNEKQDRGLNIVYRRDDGNIGWIDPNENDATPGGRASSNGHE